MDIRAPGWFPHRDGREDLGEGIGSSGPCVMRFRTKIWKDLDRGKLGREGSRWGGKTHASEDG